MENYADSIFLVGIRIRSVVVWKWIAQVKNHALVSSALGGNSVPFMRCGVVCTRLGGGVFYMTLHSMIVNEWVCG